MVCYLCKDCQRNLFNRIHNLANDLKSGLITWEEFDKQVKEVCNCWNK